MPRIKDVGAIALKWSQVTPQRTDQYTAGVQSPRVPWAQATTAAAETYKTAVTQAANNGSFAKGVAKAGDQTWQSKTVAKGPARFAEGVASAAPDYQAGFAPYAAVIAATNLPPRFPKGDPRNITRVATMAAALNAKRTGK